MNASTETTRLELALVAWQKYEAARTEALAYWDEALATANHNRDTMLATIARGIDADDPASTARAELATRVIESTYHMVIANAHRDYMTQIDGTFSAYMTLAGDTITAPGV